MKKWKERYKMKKKLLIFSLLTILALAMTGCGSSESEDPSAQKESIDSLDNSVVEAYLNQYNLDAENTISTDDLSSDDDETFTCKIAKLDVKLSAPDEDLTVDVTFDDLNNENLDVVVRDLIIAMDADLTYENVQDMFTAFRDNGKTSYDLGNVKVKLSEKSGTYDFKIS